MKVFIDSRTLAEKLEALSGFRNGIRITADVDTLCLSAFDRCLVDVKGITDVAVPGTAGLNQQGHKALLGVLQKVDGNVNLERVDNRLVLTGNGQRASFWLDDIVIPTMSEPQEGNGFKVKDLANLVDRLAFSIATGEEAREILTGVYCEQDGGIATWVAADGRRMSICSSMTDNAASSSVKFIMPGGVFRRLPQIFCGSSAPTIQADKNVILVSSFQRRLLVPAIAGPYFDYRRMLKAHDNPIASFTIKSDEIVAFLKAAKSFDAENVTVSVGETEGVEFSYYGMEGRAHMVADVPRRGNGRIVLQTRYLVEAVKSFDEAEVSITDKCSMLFTQADYTHVLMGIDDRPRDG